MTIAKEATSKDERRLAAVVFTDLVSYTALTQEDEPLALEVLEKQKRKRLEQAAEIFRRLGGKNETSREPKPNSALAEQP